MIVLETHIWVWWVHADPHLSQYQMKVLESHEKEGLGVSVISCWEIAKLVEYRRRVLPCSLEEWFDQALTYPGIQLLQLTPQIAPESTRLPGKFHRDPADQIIVATARILDSPLISSDARMMRYVHVKKPEQ